jgi:hypothetical protein
LKFLLILTKEEKMITNFKPKTKKEVLALRQGLKYYPVTVVLGLNKKYDTSDNPLVSVWYKGVLANCKNHPGKQWPNWHTDALEGATRFYPIAHNEVELMNKGQIKQMLGIDNLKSNQNGYRLYKDTLIGDVLYITYDTNYDSWLEAVRCGIIDRDTSIHLDDKIDTNTLINLEKLDSVIVY